MGINFPNTPTFTNMERYMDLAARKQSLVVSNLANIDTPGYRTLDFSIELAMQEATRKEPGIVLRRSHSRHLSGVSFTGLKPPAAEVDDLPQRNDGNNVDLDREMLNLSPHASKFALVTQVMRSEFRILQHTITEGK